MRDVTANIRNLKASERAFEVDLGAPGAGRTGTVAVEVIRGEIEEGFLPVKVRARQVDAAGATQALNGVSVTIPLKVHSINVSALAEGTLNIEHEVASATADAVERARKHLVALEAWFKLPAEPAPITLNTTRDV